MAYNSRKNEFEGLYQGINEEMPGIAVAYTRKGNYSVFIAMENPVMQYCADEQEYLNAAALFESIVKTLGDGYALQKQDIFSRQVFNQDTEKLPFLSRHYMEYFKGREYTEIQTYLIITQEIKSSAFNLFDKKRWEDFWIRLKKIQDILSQNNIKSYVLNVQEVVEYLHRYLGVNFRKGVFSFDNFITKDTHVEMGNRAFRIIDIVDIDEVLLPPTIKPSAAREGFPSDLFSFLSTVPGADLVIYTQSLLVPSQRKEISRLTSNMNRKKNIKDPGNLLAAADIERLMEDIALNNKILVYTNYSVMIVVNGSAKELETPYNYLEKCFYDLGISISKCAYNQLELFISTFPGNEYALQEYERFLCPHDAAVCFMFKERLKADEDTPLKIYYADRQGIPRAIDVTGKEGKVKLTTNSNFFSLGPSGSGKSFNMNSVVRQLYEQDTDIVMVDTGNSYEGLCAYVKGKYLAYTKEKPISMNPFRITEEENNIEKQNFLKSLVFLLWKGSNAQISNIEDTLMSNVIDSYYRFYFHPFNGFSEEQKNELRGTLMLELKSMTPDQKKDLDPYREKFKKKILKLQQLAKNNNNLGEATNARQIAENLIEKYDISKEELDNPEKYDTILVEQQIEEMEENLANIKVESLSFNSFYEFCYQFIPYECRHNKISFDMANFTYALKHYYKGGIMDNILNEDLDDSLFNEKFIVFEIEAIKDDPKLFPIVTLIIMDVFTQKMRLKKNRKALIIEEAWKAIASPLMAGYIKYLYKTVRKFWGIVGVVTQEIDDIISNETVKETIINNSEITFLLDQSKFKERYTEIAKLLGLSEVEQKKIWTINNLDNKNGRSYFKEVYIRRGTYGEVFGVEESPQTYMAYTTERIEKDALKIYLERCGNDYEKGIVLFCEEWKKMFPDSVKPDEFSSIVNKCWKIYSADYMDDKLAMQKLVEDWKEFDRAKKKSMDNDTLFVDYIAKSATHP